MEINPEPKTRRGRPRKIPAKTTNSLPDGTFVPDTPTTGADLMAIHKLPEDAWNGVSLKIKRQIPGSQQFELVAESTIETYEMAQVAQTFGPGTYMVTVPADPSQRWGARNNTFRVSPDYARQAGWGAIVTRAPVSTMREAATFTDTANALKGSQLDPLQLAQLMEVIAEKTASRILQANQQAQPMAGMPTLDTAIGMMSQIRSIEDAAVARYLKLQEGAVVPEPTTEDDSWAGIIKTALPMVLQAVSPVLQRIGQPAQTPTTIEPEVPMGHEFSVPKEIEGPIAMLRPFGGMILELLQKSPVDRVARDLVQYVPTAMRPALATLAGIVAQDGPAILQAIHPGLATQAGSALLAMLAEIIQEDAR